MNTQQTKHSAFLWPDSHAELLAALKMAVAALKDNNIDESMAGEFEILTDAINKATH